MKLIRDAEFGYDLDEYLKHLEGARDRMPASMADFALAPWHYDASHHQCPHDSWVESVVIEESSEGSRNQDRTLNIRAKFLGAYHDISFEIIYKNVLHYSMSLQSSRRIKAKIGHGDWIIDEILCADDGTLSHEIIFSDSGHWFIQCEDMTYSWQAITASGE